MARLKALGHCTSIFTLRIRLPPGNSLVSILNNCLLVDYGTIRHRRYECFFLDMVHRFSPQISNSQPLASETNVLPPSSPSYSQILSSSLFDIC